MKIDFPENYPELAPKIYFLTPIYHPNVSPNSGYVSFSVTNCWNYNTTVTEMITKLYCVFYLINPDGGFSGKMSAEYNIYRPLFEKKQDILLKNM